MPYQSRHRVVADAATRAMVDREREIRLARDRDPKQARDLRMNS
jgi:hypothetical protein